MNNFKDIIKPFIPKKLKPIILRQYRRLFEKKPLVDLSTKYQSLQNMQALKCTIAYNKYGGYCVPLSSHHRPNAQYILGGGVAEPDTIEYMIKNCKNGDIISAGAYYGDFLPALSEGVSNNAKVWTFEPNIENYLCAKITLEINYIKNTILTNTGLGEKEEVKLLATKDVSGRSLGGTSRVIHSSEKIRDMTDLDSIRIVTIDDIINEDRSISILQLDVEGYELEALKGALKTIKR